MTRPPGRARADDFRERLAGATREIRVRRGLSLTEVARRGGFGERYPGRLERGRADPTLSQLVRLSEALGLSGVSELIRAAASYEPPRST